MNIPKDLLKEALQASGAATQTMAVVMGLQELIRKKQIRRLLALQGSGAVQLTQGQLRRMRRR